MAGMTERLPVVGVMGSGRASWEPRSAELGAWLARRGVHLLTGGGGGVMSAVSRAFCEVAERRGRVLGVLPCRDEATPTTPPPGYPNPWVEIPIRTHLPWSGERGRDPLSRNHVNVLSSDVVVALPGSSGTLSEILLAREYGRPLVAWIREPDELPGLPADVPTARELDEVSAFVESCLRGR